MKRLYFFRPNLKNHFYLYYSWVSAAKEKGVDVTMFTVMSRQQIKKQINEYKEVSKLDGVKVIKTPHTTLNMLYTAIYLFFNMLKYKKVALIAKKVELRPLRLTKFIFGKNFKYYIEVLLSGRSLVSLTSMTSPISSRLPKGTRTRQPAFGSCSLSGSR